MLTQRSHPGTLLIEAIIAVAIASIIFAALARFAVGAYQYGDVGKQYTVGAFYAVEGLEAVQSIATQNFSLLGNQTYGVVRGSGSYALVGTSDTRGSYTRTVTISPGYRSNGPDPILKPNSTGAPDVDNAKTKKVISEVTWQSGIFSRKVTLTTFVTKWW